MSVKLLAPLLICSVTECSSQGFPVIAGLLLNLSVITEVHSGNGLQQEQSLAKPRFGLGSFSPVKGELP